jgi:SAM-dependent methyltransferase
MFSTLTKKATYLHSMGPQFVLHEVKTRVLKREEQLPCSLTEFSGVGIEIGGLSAIFRAGNLLPVYETARRIDNVTFANTTRWEGSIEEGQSFLFDPSKPAGTQFILDGGDLSSLPGEAYDFVISSHMLEHSANPLRVLHGWKRLLRPGGNMLLVLPHRDSSFDHRRPITTISHLVSDFENERTEDDDSHFDEIVALHDLRRDPGQESAETFSKWIFSNTENRGAHHHTFDLHLAIELLDQVGFQLNDAFSAMPMHIVLSASKPGLATGFDNAAFLARSYPHFRSSPFRTDREIAAR